MSNLLLNATDWVDVSLSGALVQSTAPAAEFNTGSGQWNFTGSAAPNTHVIRYTGTPGASDIITLSLVSPSDAGAQVRVWLNSFIDGNGDLNVQSIGGTAGTIDLLPTADFDQQLTAGQTYTFTSQAGIGQVVILVDTQTSGAANLDLNFVPLQQIGDPVAGYSWASGGTNGLTVTFTDESTQDNGTISSWNWAFGDGQSSQLQNPVHAYATAGSYTVQLTVTGTSGLTGTITKTVNVPALAASFNFSSSGLAATLVSTSVTSPAYTINTYYWDFGDGHTLSGPTANPTHTYAQPGTYNVSLMVEDTSGSGISQAYVHAVTVAATGPANTPPAVDFTAVVDHLAVTFTDQTTSADSTITDWLWAFGDGATSTAQNPSHSYSMASTFTVTLTTTDALGISASKSIQVLTTAPSSTANGDTSTYTLKGFVSISALADNSANVTANAGELSTYSQTFARDISLFGTGASNEALQVTVFSSQDVDGNAAQVPSDYATTLVAMGQWIYLQSVAGTFTGDPASFIDAFQTNYTGTVQSVTTGEMVKQGTIWLPSSVEFFFTNASTVQPGYTSNSRIKLWFSDHSFRNEYDLYEIAFVPPVANIDDFFSSATVVQAAVSARTQTQMLQLVQAAANGDPYTILASSVFNWVDPTNPQHLIPTNWTYLIWGAAGDNVDAIKQALQAYILAHSSHTSAEWAAIFPDIFATTEFIITPLWTQYAIPNQENITGMYSPVVNPNQALQYAIETAVGTGYSAQFVQNYMNIVPLAYKAMSSVIVGGPQNEGGVSEFAKQWTDYLDVATSSTDFDRMQPDTQNFIVKLSGLLLAAETMTASSDVPADITRLTRTNAAGDQVMYAVMAYNGIDYLCVTKDFMISKYGASTNTQGSVGISYDGTFANGAFQLLSSVPTMTLQFVAENATLPLTFELVDTTCTNASINASTGLFTGTFPSNGSYTVTLKLTDAQGHAVQTTFTFNFQQPTSGSQALGITSASFPASGTVGAAYNGTALIVGGTGPYTIVSQTLPAGLSAAIDQSQLTVSGTPTAATSGTLVANVTVADSATPTAAQAQVTWDVTVGA